MKKLMLLLFVATLAFAMSATARADRAPLGVKKGNADNSSAPTPVPEPLSIALLGGGLVGLYGLKKKFDKD